MQVGLVLSVGTRNGGFLASLVQPHLVLFPKVYVNRYLGY